MTTRLSDLRVARHKLQEGNSLPVALRHTSSSRICDIWDRVRPHHISHSADSPLPDGTPRCKSRQAAIPGPARVSRVACRCQAGGAARARCGAACNALSVSARGSQRDHTPAAGAALVAALKVSVFLRITCGNRRANNRAPCDDARTAHATRLGKFTVCFFALQ